MEQRRQVEPPRRPCSRKSGPRLDYDGPEGVHGCVRSEVEVKAEAEAEEEAEAEAEGRVELARYYGSTCRRAPDTLDGHGRRGCG